MGAEHVSTVAAVHQQLFCVLQLLTVYKYYMEVIIIKSA